MALEATLAIFTQFFHEVNVAPDTIIGYI